MKRACQLCIVILLLLLFTSNSAFSQIDKEVNRIFIWDVTQSMKGYGGTEDIWDEVKDKMIESIKNIPTNDGNIIIIPFQEQIIKPIFNQRTSEAGKNNAIKFLNNFNNKDVTNTNICRAWDEAFDFIDADRKNYIFIYTDGLQTSKSPGYEPECLSRLADKWCKMASEYRDCYGVYIILKSSAGLPSNLENDICKSCPDHFTCSESADSIITVINIAHLNPEVHLNLREDNLEKTLYFDYLHDLPDDFKYNVSVGDNACGLRVENSTSLQIARNKESLIRFALPSDINMEEEEINDRTELRFEITKQIPGYHIVFTPPIISIILKNRPERVITIKPHEE
ncbi:MAG: VWA domain-containing protein [Bacteroidales bacterium]|nr:VWA domain-containing protein [Bacteroidales bacterium]